MKELTLKRRLNTYLYRGYPGISSNFENGTKQLEAQLENRVAYKEKYVYCMSKYWYVKLKERFVKYTLPCWQVCKYYNSVCNSNIK